MDRAAPEASRDFCVGCFRSIQRPLREHSRVGVILSVELCDALQGRVGYLN
jgi:hypothetical protein